MDSILDSAVKSTGTTENRGVLVRKAGLENSTTIKDSTIFKEMERITDRISDLQDRYNAREDYWWSVFTNLESMMSDLNSQSSYLSSYLGSATMM
jgi:flagellar hook-associated protein 2